MPIVPLRTGKYSDTGYRFRRNLLERVDDWPIGISKFDEFYDYIFYNSDTFDTDGNNTLISEMYFRLEVDEVSHTRIVMRFMDFIGDIGGVYECLTHLCRFVLAGYCSFHAKLAIMSSLYRVKS